MIPIIDSTMNHMSLKDDEMAFNDDRAMHLSNMLSIVSDCIRETLDSNETMFEGFSLDDDRIKIPLRLSVQLRSKEQLLTYKSVWGPAQKESTRKARETREKNMKNKLNFFKRKPVDLREMTPNEHSLLIQKLETITVAEVDKLLVSRTPSKHEQGVKLYALMNGAQLGRVWKPRVPVLQGIRRRARNA